MIMLWMIVQQYFNSDRTPFSKVALALCALMMINDFEIATKLHQCPCTLLQGCTDTACTEKNIATLLKFQNGSFFCNTLYHNENAPSSKVTLALLALNDACL